MPAKIFDVAPNLETEWDFLANSEDPYSLSAGSGKNVYWRCKLGHTWRAVVRKRTAGHKCPYCSNKKILRGFNDLATLFPEYAREWHPTLNGEVLPQDVGAGSGIKYWWICSKGHEWYVTPDSRTRYQTGCGVCEGRKLQTGVNDFATMAPHLVQFWHTEKNEGLTPELFHFSSKKTVWWQCNLGHEWRSSVTASYFRKSFWCEVCSYYKLLKGFNDIVTLSPTLANDWDFEKNGDLHPSEVTVGSNQKVWWRCSKGHSWEATPGARFKGGTGCPGCKKSRLELIVESFLVRNGLQFLKNTKPLKSLKTRRAQQLDFVLIDYKIAFEVQDFTTHSPSSDTEPLSESWRKFISKDAEFKHGPTYHESKRERAMNELGLTLIDLWQDEIETGVFENIVMSAIEAEKLQELKKLSVRKSGD